jgi:serine/threonine protein kinase
MANSIKEIIQKEYEILAGIAEGGEAKIYKVKNKKYEYIRAIRFYNSPIESDSSDDKTYKYFINECKILLRLGNGVHPHIIRIAEPKIIGAHPVYEMDYLEGCDLATRLETEKCFDISTLLKMLAEMSSALAYCHYDVYKYSINPDDPKDEPYIFFENKKWIAKKGAEEMLVSRYKVIHNDIHSRNIFIKNDGNFILLDFGLSFVGDKVSRMTRQKGGIYEYMAPEKFDDIKLTEQSDIYSFGIVLFECLTGRLPFVLKNANSPAMSDINTLSETHKNSPIPDLWDIRKAALKSKGINQTEKDYPDWLEVVIRKCLAKKPADRYQNGKELHNAVTKALEKQAIAEKKTLIDQQLAQQTEKYEEKLRELNSDYAFNTHNRIFEHEQQLSKLSAENQQQITKLETELETLKSQNHQATSDTTNQYQTEITTLKIKTENLNKRLDTKTQELTTKTQTFESQIATLNQTITDLKNRPITEKIIEKIVAVLPESSKEEIEKVKSRTLGQLVGMAAIVALLGGGVGWVVETVVDYSTAVMASDSGFVEDNGEAVDSTATPANDSGPTLAQCEEVLNGYEKNIEGSIVPDQNRIDQLVMIVQAYPQLKDQAYRIYYQEAIRLNNIEAGNGSKFMKIAEKIKAL